MPQDLHAFLNDLFNPATLLGIAFYAILFAFFAWFLGRIIRLAVHRLLHGHVPGADPTAVRFLGQLARLIVYILAVLSYIYVIPRLHQLGSVWLTSVGLVSVIVGIAAQSTLGNLIAGVSLLLYRPFRIGDRLQINGPSGLETGTVDSLSLGYTTLQTDDNRRIIIPNSVMANQISINISALPRRVPCTLALNLAPTADLAKARTLLTVLAKADPRITELSSIRITSLTDVAATLTLTAWCADLTAAAEAKSDLFAQLHSRLPHENLPLAH